MRLIHGFEMLLLAALWGLSFYFMRASGHEFGPVTLIFLRTLLAAICLTPLLLYKNLLSESLRHWKHLFAVGVLNSALPFTLFSIATLSLEAGFTSMLNATAPMFGALFGALWLKQTLSVTAVAGIILGFIGVSSLVADNGITLSGSLYAITAAIAGSACYGIAACYSKKYLNGVAPLTVATGSQWMSALMLIIPSIYLWPSQTISAQAWWNVVLLGTVSTALAYVMYYHLIKCIGAIKAITVAYLVPVFGILWGVLLLDEQISLSQSVSGILVLFGVSLTTGIKINFAALKAMIASKVK